MQRFREGFTELPAACRIGAGYDRDPALARGLAEAAGLVAATELRRAGVDLDFAPVVDLGAGNEETIGERAFHSGPEAVTDLARSWLRGAGRAGFAGVGKHFPGHGTARGDTHLDVVEDARSLARLRAARSRAVRRPLPVSRRGDDQPRPLSCRRSGGRGDFLRGVATRRVEARSRLCWYRVQRRSFDGRGRGDRGSPEARVGAALAAGCDAALVMNDRPALVRVLDGWRPGEVPPTRDLGRLRPLSRRQAPEREYHAARALLREHLG